MGIRQMKIDITKPTKMKLQLMISEINNLFDEGRKKNDLPKFAQLRLVHLEKRTYLIRAEQYDSKTFKKLKSNDLQKGSIGDLTYFIFSKFYTSKEVA
jgi:hypothetical protein